MEQGAAETATPDPGEACIERCRRATAVPDAASTISPGSQQHPGPGISVCSERMPLCELRAVQGAPAGLARGAPTRRV